MQWLNTVENHRLDDPPGYGPTNKWFHIESSFAIAVLRLVRYLPNKNRN